MPKLIRPMKFDPSDNLPLTGTDKSKILGVRVTGDHADIELEPAGDFAGNALANGKGLSVNADWQNLPAHLLPDGFDDGRNGSAGKAMKLYLGVTQLALIAADSA